MNAIDAVRLLLEDPRVDVTLVDSDGASCLLMAAQGGHEDVVRLLLKDQRVNPNLGLRTKETPLFSACQFDKARVARLLLEDQGVSVNVANHNGAPALWVGAQNGHAECVKLLLGLRVEEVEVQAKTRGGTNVWSGKTALEIAMMNKHQEIVDLLALWQEDRGLAKEMCWRDTKVGSKGP